MELPPNVLSQSCASRRYLALVASKWPLLVINALDDGPARNSFLMRKVGGISQKILTQTLRDLAAASLVSREDHGTLPPHVTYRLTPLGQSFRREVRSLIAWVEGNMPALRGAEPDQH